MPEKPFSGGGINLHNEKITAKKGYEIVMEHLRKQIEQGELKPGEKLDSVVDLAARYGVGRSTIREALSALKAMGWLDIKHGGGTFVKKELPTTNGLSLFNPKQSLREVLEVRKILETEAARLAARNRTEKNLIRLDQVLEQMKLHLDDEEQSEKADVAFHLEIARASQNGLLHRLMESLSNHLLETIRDTRRLWFYGEAAEATKLLQEHSSIHEAIASRNAELAASRMRSHLERVERTLLER